MKYLLIFSFACLCNAAWGQALEWQTVSVPDAVASDSSYIRAFAVDPHLNLYIGLDWAKSGFRAGVYRRLTGGHEWSRIYERVDQILATTKRLYLAHGCGGVMRAVESHDSAWETLYQIPSIAYYCLTVRDFKVVGDSLMYLALGGSSARRSVDGGATWSNMNVMGYSLMVNFRGTVYMGCMGGGPPRYSIDNGSTWEPFSLPESGLEQCWLSGVSARDVLFLGWSRSIDDGQSWMRYGQELPLPSGRLLTSREGLSLMAFGRAGSVFIGTGQGVWQSLDDGASWSLVGLAERQIVGLSVDAADHLYAITSEDEFFRTISPVTVGTEPTSVPGESGLVGSSFPNPFSSSSTIRIVTPTTGHGIVRLVDLLGRVVKTVSLGPLATGDHILSLDSGDLPSGVYIVRVDVGRLSTSWLATMNR